jgi:AGZA family xanthine/uracil permease-like MFS transporter
MLGGGYAVSKDVVLYPVIAPALVIVGSMMLKTVRDIPWDDPTEIIPAFLTLMVMPMTFSIT